MSCNQFCFFKNYLVVCKTSTIIMRTTNFQNSSLKLCLILAALESGCLYCCTPTANCRVESLPLVVLLESFPARLLHSICDYRSLRANRQLWSWFIWWQINQSKPCQEEQLPCTPQSYLKLVFCRMTYWRKDDKVPLHCLKYQSCLTLYSGDWQLQLPSQAGSQAVLTEAWVAVMILYGVKMLVL